MPFFLNYFHGPRNKKAPFPCERKEALGDNAV